MRWLRNVKVQYFLKETLKMVNNGIVVFISGRGSNLNAIINAVNDGVIKYPISAVVSDRYCEGVEISRKIN